MRCPCDAECLLLLARSDPCARALLVIEASIWTPSIQHQPRSLAHFFPFFSDAVSPSTHTHPPHHPHRTHHKQPQEGGAGGVGGSKKQGREEAVALRKEGAQASEERSSSDGGPRRRRPPTTRGNARARAGALLAARRLHVGLQRPGQGPCPPALELPPCSCVCF